MDPPPPAQPRTFLKLVEGRIDLNALNSTDGLNSATILKWDDAQEPTKRALYEFNRIQLLCKKMKVPLCCI
jgi:hypothetical protein